MKNRMEIFRDGTWYFLRLKEKHAIKYNAVVNKVAEVRSREISHSNTFSVPNTSDNRIALGLNVFNARSLARALNSKYIAKYYIGDKLIKEGFIVINNSETDIKLNFLDAALGLVDTWKSTTFKQLLQSDEITRPAEYQTAIDEMRSYDMATGNAFNQLSLIAGENYELALFPNNLNQIGDDFQVGSSESRDYNDVFISAQSRPVFNAKAAFDLATKSFDYTPIYDESIDWEEVSKNFFTGDKASEGRDDEDALLTIENEKVLSTEPYVGYFNFSFGFQSEIHSKTLMKFPTEVSRTGSFLEPTSNVVQNQAFADIFPARPLAFSELSSNYNKLFSENCFYKPNFDGGNSGTITFKASFEDIVPSIVSNPQIEHRFFGAWETTSSSTSCVIAEIPLDTSAPSGVVRIDKTFANTPPAEASDVFLGVLYQATRSVTGSSLSSNIMVAKMTDMQVVETAIPQGEIAFDGFGGYGVTVNDLTHAAPEKPIKDILAGLMHQAGILMNIDAVEKKVKFFSYGHYQTQKENGEYEDWSKYFLKSSLIKRNTDYGKNFGKLNRIGLKKPYLGNTYDRTLSNHVEDSKYKAFSKDESKSFSDIISAKEVPNATIKYFEYEVKGMSMVNKVGYINGLEQKTPFGVSQGTITDLANLSNVNYFSIPHGVSEWYNLVDGALRVVGKFLLPVSEIKNLDISKPVYIGELGGFYIVEEISEYTDSKTPVNIKLIKLIDNLRES